ncbi:MAG TPA: ATP-binding protein [Thermodesulfobacteriota bacterium]|nr:ATP-binding protein [Thermodesulfobacteriota bacterium]
MAPPTTGTGLLNLPDELEKRKKIILGELRERTLWFIKLRWCVPVSMGIGIAVARWIGVEFKASALLLLASFILTYNVVFFFLSRRVKSEPHGKEYIERFTYWQVGFDYGTMFLLIYFTGGLASPFIFFFIFHITFSAIFLPRRSAYSLAAFAAIGVGLISAAEYLGWIPHHDLLFQGKAVDFGRHPFRLIVIFGFFSGFLFITALSITAVMRMLEKRIVHLADLTEAVTTLNDKLNTLYTMTQAIGSKQHLEQVLSIVSSELARVMGVQAISVKLLSEDGKLLQFAAAHGLPAEYLKHKIVEVAKSPLNCRVIEGEPFVSGHVTERESFQFGEDLEAAQLQSVQFVPLIVETRVIGILGAYSTRPEQFGPDELNFFRQAAGLVAIAMENARAYEAIENVIEERSRFMNRVAHNLRAPLAALASMLEVVRDGYLGNMNDELRRHLSRIDQRVQNMLLMINELMTLAKSQSKQRRREYGSVDLTAVMDRIHQTFQEKTAEKRLSFTVTVPEDLPKIKGDEEMVEQMLENLVSNAIKYTPEGGRIGMTFWPGTNETIRIVLSDNGIGIPKDEIPRLFTEFFRASNVKNRIGTGLGLTIVKEIVDQHGGHIEVESEEGFGTTFVIYLPCAPKEIVSS